MPDLFLFPDDHFLFAKWEHLFGIFRIVSRDYRQVLSGESIQDRHRLILIQTVSDLIDLETDIYRLGKDSPADGLTGRQRDLWMAAALWVRELRAWRFPHEGIPIEEVEAAIYRRRRAEEEFNSTVLDPAGSEWVDTPQVTVDRI